MAGIFLLKKSGSRDVLIYLLTVNTIWKYPHSEHVIVHVSEMSPE